MRRNGLVYDCVRCKLIIWDEIRDEIREERIRGRPTDFLDFLALQIFRCSDIQQNIQRIVRMGIVFS